MKSVHLVILILLLSLDARAMQNSLSAECDLRPNLKSGSHNSPITFFKKGKFILRNSNEIPVQILYCFGKKNLRTSKLQEIAASKALLIPIDPSFKCSKPLHVTVKIVKGRHSMVKHFTLTETDYYNISANKLDITLEKGHFPV